MEAPMLGKVCGAELARGEARPRGLAKVMWCLVSLGGA